MGRILGDPDGGENMCSEGCTDLKLIQTKGSVLPALVSNLEHLANEWRAVTSWLRAAGMLPNKPHRTGRFLCSPWVFVQSILSHQEYRTFRVMLTLWAIFNLVFFLDVSSVLIEIPASSELPGEEAWTNQPVKWAWKA